MNVKDIKAEQKAAALSAAMEKRFSSENVAEEIMSLLNEYFIGHFEQNGNEIKLNFQNGQRFVLSINKG